MGDLMDIEELVEVIRKYEDEQESRTYREGIVRRALRAGVCPICGDSVRLCRPRILKDIITSLFCAPLPTERYVCGEGHKWSKVYYELDYKYVRGWGD